MPSLGEPPRRQIFEIPLLKIIVHKMTVGIYDPWKNMAAFTRNRTEVSKGIFVNITQKTVAFSVILARDNIVKD